MVSRSEDYRQIAIEFNLNLIICNIDSVGIKISLSRPRVNRKSTCVPRKRFESNETDRFVQPLCSSLVCHNTKPSPTTNTAYSTGYDTNYCWNFVRK